MKNSRMKNIRWKKYVVMMLIGVVSFVLLAGCSTAAPAQESQGTVSEESLQKEAVQEEAVENVVQEETVEEPVQQTLEEWIDSLEIAEPKYCSWNESKMQGVVFENGQTYQLEEGEVILIYKPVEEGIETMTIPNETVIDNVEVNEKYNILNLIYYNRETEFKTRMEAKSGNVYQFDFTIILPETFPVKSKDDLSGEDWQDIISKQEPQFLVWNDETGTKQYIPDGGEYQLQEGDQIAVYSGIDRYIIEIRPLQCAWNYDTGYIEVSYLSTNQPTEITAKLANFYNNDDIVEISCTILPME